MWLFALYLHSLITPNSCLYRQEYQNAEEKLHKGSQHLGSEMQLTKTVWL